MSSLVQMRWDAKLKNWALWYAGSGRQSRGAGAYDKEWWKSPPRPPQPLVGDAVDTDQLVAMLSLDQFFALQAWYLWTGFLEDRASDLKDEFGNPAPVHVNTLENRVIAARYRLDELDAKRRRGAIRAPVSVVLLERNGEPATLTDERKPDVRSGGVGVARQAPRGQRGSIPSAPCTVGAPDPLTINGNPEPAS